MSYLMCVEIKLKEVHRQLKLKAVYSHLKL